MELKTFVAKTITEIISGIEEAQAATSGGRGRVVPTMNDDSLVIAETGFSPIQVISFEVCITTEEVNGTDGKINVATAFLGLGGGASSSKEAKNASTVSFKVPVRLPMS